MRKAFRLLTAALCLSALADFAFASGVKMVPAKEGIVMAEGEAQIYRDGFKVTTVTLLYRKKLDPTSVTADDYSVEGYDIKSVSVDGKNVRIFLNCDNFWYPGNDNQEVNPEIQFSKFVTVTQKGEVKVSGGNTVYAGPATIQTKKIAEPKIVREFQEKAYRDDETGIELRYCLYMPLYYTEGWNYPVIVFIPDSRANTNISKSTLLQGEGGTVWATEAEQDKHKSIIIAIQYPKYVQEKHGPLIHEDGSWSDALDVIYRAVRRQVENFRVDRNRFYAVGQGDGAVANLMIGQKYPGFYAAQLVMSPTQGLKSIDGLQREKMWIMVSSNDQKACDAMDKAADGFSKAGVGVARATWNVDYDEKEFSKAAKDLAKKKGAIKYTVIDGGCHEYTWCIGNHIEEIRDWLMAQ